MMMRASRAFMTASVAPPWDPRHVSDSRNAQEPARALRRTVCAPSFTVPLFRLRRFRSKKVPGESEYRVKKRRQSGFLLPCLAMHQPSPGIPAAAEASPSTTIVARESGLQRNLRPAQLAMLGLGSTIGTGLFLGSAIAVKPAGPPV